jgi:hypothetical protein
VACHDHGRWLVTGFCSIRALYVFRCAFLGCASRVGIDAARQIVYI